MSSMQTIKTLVGESPFDFGVPRSPKKLPPPKTKFARKQQAARNGETTSHKYRAQAHVSKRDATKKKLTKKRLRKISERAVTRERMNKLYECG